MRRLGGIACALVAALAVPGAARAWQPEPARFGVSAPEEHVGWAAGLPRSDGRVGAAGESYVGLNQIFTAAAIGRGSTLQAIFPVTAGNDLYRDLVFAGGI